MNYSFSFLSGPIADALGWTLIHALWQGFALVLPVAMLLHVWRNRSSALRYRLSVAALVVQVLASVVTFVWYYEPVVAATSGGLLRSGSPASVWLVVQASARPLAWYQQVQQFLEAHLSQFVLAYLIGVAVFGLRLAGGWLYLQRLRRTATLPGSATLVEMVGRLRGSLRIGAAVQVRESARVLVPMVVGAVKPVLLLPVGLLTNLSLREVEMVLAHELAHVKRHDYGVNLLQSVVEVLYFFHPALWWLSARVREEREHCCDDLAILVCGGNGRVLAQALARVEELRLAHTSPPTLAMAFASRRRQLLHRVRRALGVQSQPVTSNATLAGLTFATLLLLSASVYAMQQHAPQPKPKKPVSTQRFKGDDGVIEFGMTNKRLTYVVWKGQKLPNSRVTQLQQQLDDTFDGRVNLDAVPQPNRDILLEIIEKYYAQKVGMAALSEGLSHIGTGNMSYAADADLVKSVDFTPVAQFQDSILLGSTWLAKKPIVEVIDSVQVDGQWKKVADSYRIWDNNALSPKPVQDTTRLSAVQRQLEVLTKRMQEVMAERKPVVERLTRELSELTLKAGDWRKQGKQQGELARLQADLARQQAALSQQAALLNREMARLAQQNTAKANQLLRQKQQQSDQLEKQMDRLGDKMGNLDSQMGDLSKKMEPYHQRIGALSDSISRLYEPVYDLSSKIGELSNELAEEAYGQAEQAMKAAEDAMRNLDFDAIENRPARAPQTPRAPRALRPPKPAKVRVIEGDVMAPAIAPSVARPVVPVKPAPAPRPATTARPAAPVRAIAPKP